MGVVTESWTPWCGGVWFVASYTWEQKVRAVERYLSCGGRALDVIRSWGIRGVSGLCSGGCARWRREAGGRAAASGAAGRARGVAGGVRERGDDADRGGGSGGRDPSAVAHWKRRMSLEGREPVMRDGDAPMTRASSWSGCASSWSGRVPSWSGRGPSWPRWPPVWSGTGPRAGSWGSSWRCAGARWSWWGKGGAQTRKT